MSVCLSCCNKIPDWVACTNNRIFFLTELEAGCLRSRHWVVTLWQKPSSWFLASKFWLCPHSVRGEGALWDLFYKSTREGNLTTSFMRVEPNHLSKVPPPWGWRSNHLLKTPPTNTVTLGRKISTYEFGQGGGNKHSDRSWAPIWFILDTEDPTVNLKSSFFSEPYIY